MADTMLTSSMPGETPEHWAVVRMQPHRSQAYLCNMGRLSLRGKCGLHPREIPNAPLLNQLAARRILHRQRLCSRSELRSLRPLTSLGLLPENEVEEEGPTGRPSLQDSQRRPTGARSAPPAPRQRPLPQGNDAKDVVNRLSSLEPEKLPETRGYAMRLRTPVVYREPLSDEEVVAILRRLRQSPAMAGKGELVGAVPTFIREFPRQTMVRIRRCPPVHVQHLVDRIRVLGYSSPTWSAESVEPPMVPV